MSEQTVSKIPDEVDPPTTRLIWLRLALLIADGAPEPRDIAVRSYENGPGVQVRFNDNDRASVDHWASLLGLPTPTLTGPMHAGRWFADYRSEALGGRAWLGCYSVQVGSFLDAAEPVEPAELSPVEADAAELLRRAVAE